jgi:hypothetical protein
MEDKEKYPRVLSLNAACDQVPDCVKGTDLIILRFDAEDDDHLVFAGQIAGMKALNARILLAEETVTIKNATKAVD